MGSGKTTLGQQLAKDMNREFLDLDVLIEHKEQRSIPAIFAQRGENYFRELEARTLHDIVETHTNTVVALGGGTVCYHNNLALLKKNGLLVYLQVPPAELQKRLLAKSGNRPLLNTLSGETLPAYIETKLASRESFYKQAHLTVKSSVLTVQELLAKIAAYEA